MARPRALEPLLSPSKGAFRLSVHTNNFTLNLGWRYRNGGENPRL
jgi:hypothetical protein